MIVDAKIRDVRHGAPVHILELVNRAPIWFTESLSHDLQIGFMKNFFFRLALAVAVAFWICQSAPVEASGWFWAEVPAKVAEGSRAGAIRVIQTERAKGRRLFGSKTLFSRVLSRWRPEIEAAARHGRISEALIVAVVMVESGGNAHAVSPAGARGLGQLMPGTARRYGVHNSFDPGQNLKGSAAYLSDLIGMFRGDIVLALAAYNAGEHAVLRHKGVPPYRETRAYVPKVLAAFEMVGRFCASPPRAARRRCQFRRAIK